MTIVRFDGFEHRTLVASGAADTTLYDIIEGAPTIDTAVPRSGTACLRCNGVGNRGVDYDMTAGIAQFTIGFQFRWTTRIDGDRFFMLGNTGLATHLWLTFTSTNKCSLVSASATVPVTTIESTTTIPADTWHRFDLKVNFSANPWIVDWSINGGAQPQMSSAVVATQMLRIYIGNRDLGNLDLYYDDFVMDDTLAAYPLGDRKVLGYSPTAVGTHNLDASPSVFYFQHDGATPAALTTGETTSYTRVDDVPISGSTDRIYVQLTPGATQYAELQLADETGNYDVDAIRVIEAVLQGTAGGSVYTSKISDDGGVSLTNVQTALDINTATEVYRKKVITTKPSGGAWTLGALNALRYRFGFTTDAVPEIQLRALMVEALLVEARQTTPRRDPKLIYLRKNR